jgi:hypothetical protein
VRRRDHPAARQAGDRTLASRQLVALTFGRHVNLVRRVVPPVACDVATRAALLDVDDAEARLAEVATRT